MIPSTEIVVADDVLLNPVTGEAKALADLDNTEVRDGLAFIAQLERQVRDAKQKLQREAWDRKNAGNVVSGLKLERRRDWQIRDAAPAVDKLIADGKITTARETLIVPQESFKPNARSLNALIDDFLSAGDTEAASVLLSARRESFTAKVVEP